MTCLRAKYISLLHCCHLSLISTIVNASRIWALKVEINPVVHVRHGIKYAGVTIAYRLFLRLGYKHSLYVFDSTTVNTFKRRLDKYLWNEYER